MRRVLNLASASVSASVGRPSPSRSTATSDLIPACQSGPRATSATTSQTRSSGASISAVDSPSRIPTAHRVFCPRPRKELSANVTEVTPAAIDRVYEHLLDVEHYPDWYPDGAKQVEVLTRDADGRPLTVDAVLAAVAVPPRKDFPVRLQLEATPMTRIALARIADERGNHEALTIAWQLRDLGADGTEVTVELGARLDVPPFLPLDPVAREVANGFLQAALASF